MTKLVFFLIFLLSSLQLQAVHLSNNGTGQVLIFPYYTVNGGHDTLITLVNTTDEVKALRVRFREAANSREVFTFNVYLGAYDEWTGGVIANEDDIPQILSFDQSCAFPNMSIGSNTKFYDDKFTGNFSDSYSDYSYRMNEGFIEVFEMGVMNGASAEAANIVENTATNCASLENAWNAGGYWSENSQTDMLPPTGGITGSITIINVRKGLASTQEPTAFENFSEIILNYNIDHDSPSLADSSLNAQIDYDGQILETRWPTGYQAISALLMKKNISNEYVLTDSIGANTDWILTMPTRQYHIDSLFAHTSTPVAPFVEDDFSCEPYDYDFWDREQQVPQNPTPPPLPGVPTPGSESPPKGLCFSANNIIMADGESVIESPYGIFSSHLVPDNGDFDETSVLIETRATVDPTYFDVGWMDLSFEQSMVLIQDNQLTTLVGMPVIGFAVQRYQNQNVSGNRIANYEGIFSHKHTSEIIHDEPPEENKPMHIAQDGKGQVLLFPYYTVKNDINTLISVVNTTDQVKALKIRFLEGKNSRDVLDFNIYVSAYDVWSAGLVPADSTVVGHIDEPSVKLITIDNSCTVPETINGQEFLPYAFTGSYADGLGQYMDRAQEGSIEIIEMGSLGAAADIASANHNSNGVASCSRLLSNWAQPSGKWIQNPNDDILAPYGSGGLYGSVSLLDVVRGVDMTYDATAIVNFTTEKDHTLPGDLSPNLSTGNNSKTSIQTDDHGIAITNWESPLNAVTALFMQSEISNDYVTEASINAKTEWVNFYPTRQFYTDPLFSGSEINLAPFEQSDFPLMHEDCEGLSFASFNRDQQVSLYNGPIPPGLFPPAQHCWGVNTASVNNLDSIDSIFNSELQMPNWNFAHFLSIYEMEFNSGWMKNSYNDNSLIGAGENGEIHQIFGLPVLGFAAQRYINNNAEPGVIANYAVIHKNISKRKITIQAQQ